MYTLQDFLNDNPIQGLKVLTEVPNAFQIAIGSISVQELPIDDFVQKNEMILSTAIGCLDSRDAFQQFLYEIKQSEAAAAVFSSKTATIKLIPQSCAMPRRFSFPCSASPGRFALRTCSILSCKRLTEKAWKCTNLYRTNYFMHTLLRKQWKML